LIKLAISIVLITRPKSLDATHNVLRIKPTPDSISALNFARPLEDCPAELRRQKALQLRQHGGSGIQAIS
jgi:hypothetical protein